jgi:phosphoglucosamine mutase
MLAALQVLALMLRTGKPLSELAERSMQRVPQVLESITLPARRPLEEMRRLAEATQKIAKALGDDGRVLVRWSGTEPKLRIMLEGPREERIRAWAKELVDAARRDTPN